MRMRKSFPTMTRKGQKASEEPSEKMLELVCNVGGQGRKTGGKPLPVCAPWRNPSPAGNRLLIYLVYFYFHKLLQVC